MFNWSSYKIRSISSSRSDFYLKLTIWFWSQVHNLIFVSTMIDAVSRSDQILISKFFSMSIRPLLNKKKNSSDYDCNNLTAEIHQSHGWKYFWWSREMMIDPTRNECDDKFCQTRLLPKHWTLMGAALNGPTEVQPRVSYKDNVWSSWGIKLYPDGQFVLRCRWNEN